MEDDFRVSKGGFTSFLGISDAFEFDTLVYCVMYCVTCVVKIKTDITICVSEKVEKYSFKWKLKKA